MNNKSLEKELKNLRFYLKTISRLEKTSPDEEKVISHTIAGMIITINNLIDTGAYHSDQAELIEIYQLVKEARDNAIHYGYFDDYSDVYHKAKEIVSHMPEKLTNSFAKQIAATEIEEKRYVLISNSSSTSVHKEFLSQDFFVFKNLHTHEELWVKKDDVIVVENKYNGSFSYLLTQSNEANYFYKKGTDNTTKISLNEAIIGVLKDFNISNKKIKLDANIQKLINVLKENPYSTSKILVRYDDKNFTYNIHNVLREYLYNNIIDEKIMIGKFSISENVINTNDDDNININQIREKELSMSATLLDVFYMELYLKRYNSYKRLKENSSQVEVSDYTRQSLLLSLFEFGADQFSDRFLKSDLSGSFMQLFYKYKHARNELAHYPITNTNERKELLDLLDKYSESYYEILSKVYNSYCKHKIKNPYANLSNAKSIDTKHDLITNKTNKYYKIKHKGICKIIDGKKYLKLDTGNNSDTYIDVDRSLLILDYNTFSSRECIIPIDATRIVDIDINTNAITKSNYKLDKSNILDIDTYMVTLLQARDYLKSHPQYDKKHKPYFCALTVYDNLGKAIYSEGISHVLYRRYCQKVIPSRLLDVSNIILPKDLDEPILLVDKNKNIIASAYLGCIDYINKNETLTQLLTNKEQKEIDYGKLLSKDLETRNLTMITKEGKIK